MSGPLRPHGVRTLSPYLQRSRLHALTVAAAACVIGAAAQAADPKPPAPARIDVAHSAQLLIEAAESNDSVTLWIRRAGDKQLLASKDVKVSIDGKTQAVTPRTDGSFTVSTDDLRGKEPKAVEVIVGHDGIREILSGQLRPPPEDTATGILGSHNQLAWWIINIVVLLVGAIALSRRKSY
jgi:hypothetical protein